jgi:hypothetical protein
MQTINLPRQTPKVDKEKISDILYLQIQRNLKMMKNVIGLALVMGLASSAMAADAVKIKTRLDHLSGTQYVVVVSYLPSEITSITCDSWTMLGVGSWKDQNNFTIPSGPSIAVMNANKFNGYCKSAGSIKAHTDDGDFVGILDRGDGNWDASTKLTFGTK